jgi:CheY-like chemotaxis protein
MSKAKILLVDDEPDIIETVQYALEREGYTVVTATNGLEAIGAARIHVPDLILLDVMLPGENGYRVARTIREDADAGLYPHPIPVVLVTARDLSLDPEREKMFKEFSRAELVVYKPFDLDDLLSLVEKLVRNLEAAPGE